MAGQAVIDRLSAAHLFHEGRLNQSEADVAVVVKPARRGRRGLHGCQPILLGGPPGDDPLDEGVPIDAPIAESRTQTFGEHFAAAQGASGNGDDGHVSSSFSFPARVGRVRSDYGIGFLRVFFEHWKVLRHHPENRESLAKMPRHTVSWASSGRFLRVMRLLYPSIQLFEAGGSRLRTAGSEQPMPAIGRKPA